MSTGPMTTSPWGQTTTCSCGRHRRRWTPAPRRGCRPWTSPSVQVSTSTRTTEGIRALAVESCGYHALRSPVFSTSDIQAGNTLLVDVHIPANADPYWTGAVQAFAHIPSAGISNQYAGQLELTGRTRGADGTLGFSLPTAVAQAFQGEHNEAQLRFTLNANTGSPPYLFDSLRFP